MLENQIATMLEQLSNKLGVASAKIWEWALLQVKVNLITDVMIIIVAIILTAVTVFLVKVYFKNRSELDFDTEALIDIIGIFALIGLVIFDLFAVVCLFEIPKLLFNPEYAAFQSVLRELSNMIQK